MDALGGPLGAGFGVAWGPAFGLTWGPDAEEEEISAAAVVEEEVKPGFSTLTANSLASCTKANFSIFVFDKKIRFWL